MLSQYAKEAYPQAVIFSIIALLNILVGIALLFVLTPIGIVCIVAGSLHLLATRKETARRYIVAEFFRAPRYPRFSAYLLWRPEMTNLVNMGANLLVIVVCFISVGFNYILIMYIIIFSVFTSGILHAAIKMLIKFHIDTNFRIVVLRRNSSQWAMPHKSVIMPACGAYGQILLLTDETLEEVWEGRMRISQWALAEVYYPVVATGSTWKQVVHLELLYADFVLFDWSGNITANMIWELESAISLIPSARMMVVHGLNNREDVLAVLDKIRAGLGEEVCMTPGPDGKTTMSTFIFRAEFQKKMESLKAAPRSWSSSRG